MAEKLGRKWIVNDLGKFTIHNTRKRMIGVQRQLMAKGQEYRAFEILNLGKYDRQHYIGINPDLRKTRPFVVKDQKYIVPKKSVFNRSLAILDLSFASVSVPNPVITVFHFRILR